MSRVFRWQSVVPRLMLVVLGLMAVQYALGIAARSIVVPTGAPDAGLAIESSHARAALLNRQLVLDGGRIALADKTSTVEFDRCVLTLEASPLLHKQAIVEHGTISGLRLGCTTAAAGLPEGVRIESASTPDLFGTDSAERAGQWFQRVAEVFDSDLASQLESVRRTEALCSRWPGDSTAIKQRVETLKARAAELEENVRTAQANPLRHVEFLSNLSDTLAALDKDFAQVAADAQQQTDSFEADRRSIVASRALDEEFLATKLRLEPIDANALTAYLLREQVEKPLGEVIGWLRSARQLVPASASWGCGPSRGVNVLFAGCRPSPGVLIRDLRLQGTARVGGQTVEFRGMLTNFSNAPAHHPQPMQLRLKSIGSVPLDLQATIDRTAPVPRDELLVDCGGIVLPKIELGRKEELSMSLAPSTGSLSISVAVQGDNLSGDIQLVQKHVQMSPTLRGRLTNVPIAAPLAAKLANIESLAMRVSLGGTLQEPKCTLWSNLGPAVAESMDRVLRESGEQHARTLLVRAQQRVDERLASIERQAAEQQLELTRVRTQATADIARIAGQQIPPKRLSPGQLGQRLPAGSLFR